MNNEQVERSLSQQIEALYIAQLGHQPTKVTCKFLESQIAIVIEDSITQPEQVLANSGKKELATQVRSQINQQMKLQLKQLIEEVTQVAVVDLLFNSAIATGSTSTIAVLANSPQTQEM